MVEVINADYSDYVSLSSKLVNVDGAVVRMRKPLTDLRVSRLTSGFRKNSTLIAARAWKLLCVYVCVSVYVCVCVCVCASLCVCEVCV
jgi:hypothetical protein